MTARSVRNNNPLNIEAKPTNKWQGLKPRSQMTADQLRETRFCVFAEAFWGFRAAAVLLINYQDVYGIRTIQQIIERWAPKIENNVPAYVRHVCQLSGLSPDDQLNLHHYDDLAPVVKAMAIHESGGWFWADWELDKGLGLAGVPKSVKPATQSRTLAGTVASATSFSLVSEVDNLRQLLGPYESIIPYVRYAMIALGVASVALVFYAYFDDRRKTRVA